MPLRGIRGTAYRVRTDGRLGEASLPTNRDRMRRTIAKVLTRQTHRETRAAAGRVVDADRSAVRLDDRFDHAEAKTESALRTARIAAIEPAENRVTFGGGHARSVIGDGDDRGF